MRMPCRPDGLYICMLDGKMLDEYMTQGCYSHTLPRHMTAAIYSRSNVIDIWWTE